MRVPDVVFSRFVFPAGSPVISASLDHLFSVTVIIIIAYYMFYIHRYIYIYIHTYIYDASDLLF